MHRKSQILPDQNLVSRNSRDGDRETTPVSGHNVTGALLIRERARQRGCRAFPSRGAGPSWGGTRWAGQTRLWAAAVSLSERGKGPQGPQDAPGPGREESQQTSEPSN